MKILPLIIILLFLPGPSVVMDGSLAITDNDLPDLGPVMDGRYLAWYGPEGPRKSNILLYDKTRDVTFSLTEGETYDRHPSISAPVIAWHRQWEDGKTGILFYHLEDGLTMQINNPGYENHPPKVNDPFITWQASKEHRDYLFLYNTVTKLMQRLKFSRKLEGYQLNGNLLICEFSDSTGFSLSLYDLAGHQHDIVSAKQTSAHAAMAFGKSLLWVNEQGRVILYDTGKKVAKVISDSISKCSNLCTNKDQIAWEAKGRGDKEVVLYDIQKGDSEYVTTNNFDDILPTLTSNYLVWMSENGINSRYYFYHLTSGKLRQAKRNPDDWPEFIANGDQLVWNASDGNDEEVYIYSLKE